MEEIIIDDPLATPNITIDPEDVERGEKGTPQSGSEIMDNPENQIRSRQISNAEMHLLNIFPYIPDGMYLAIWLKNEMKKTHYFTDVQEAARFCEGKKDVFFHCALQNRKTDTRGNNKTAGALWFFWLDVDVRSLTGSAKNYPETINVAIEEIHKAYEGLPPNWLVKSGTGLHAYWLLDAPLILDQSDDVFMAQVKSLMQVFFWKIKTSMMENGYDIDSVSDLARVLRVAGTLNTKQKEPVLVEVLEDYANWGYQYSINEFCDYLFVEMPQKGLCSIDILDDTGKTSISSTQLLSPKMSDNEIVDLLLARKDKYEIRDLLQDGISDYASHSEDDMALCGFIANYTQDVEQIRRIFSRSPMSGRKKWSDRNSYSTPTIEKAIQNRYWTYQPKPEPVCADLNRAMVSFYKSGWTGKLRTASRNMYFSLLMVEREFAYIPGDRFFASYEKLAEVSGLSKNSIKSALKQLSDSMLIKCVTGSKRQKGHKPKATQISIMRPIPIPNDYYCIDEL